MSQRAPAPSSSTNSSTAADERRLSRIVARYGRVELICLDELG